MATIAPAPPRPHIWHRIGWRIVSFVAALALGTVARLTFEADAPLWFDEAFTGVIAGQPDLAGLVRWCRSELTGPLFYGTMWLWAQVAGVSDGALRLPGLIFSLAMPLVAWRWGHPDRDVRLFWAMALLLWLPAPIFANDARPYALLLLLATGQAIAFMAAIRRPNTARLFAWSLLTAAMGLAHYWALLIGMAQGLILLATAPRAVLRAWPAGAPFVVLAGWMALHLPFVLGVVGGAPRAGATLHGPGAIAAALFGPLPIAGLVAAAMASTVRPGRPRMSAEAWLVASGLATATVFAALDGVRPGFVLRYLLPVAPALLFGIGWWAGRVVATRPVAVVAAFTMMAAGTLGLVLDARGAHTPDQRHAFNFQQPSEWLMHRPIERVIWLWVDPISERSLDRNMAEVAGFFFARAGRPVPVEVVHVPAGVDATRWLMHVAGDRPNTGILVIGNDPRSTAAPRPAAMTGWRCREFGEGLAISTGCYRP